MKRPWNIIDTPVYSLATYHDDVVNMNICTYVTAISMHPKLYGVAVYQHTKTLQLLQASSTAVLQILHPDQISLVKPLGKKSGFNFDKALYLQKKGWTDTWNEYMILKGCAAYILLNKTSSVASGDHEFFIFEAIRYKTVSEEILQFQELIKQKIIL